MSQEGTPIEKTAVAQSAPANMSGTINALNGLQGLLDPTELNQLASDMGIPSGQGTPPAPAATPAEPAAVSHSLEPTEEEKARLNNPASTPAAGIPATPAVAGKETPAEEPIIEPTSFEVESPLFGGKKVIGGKPAVAAPNPSLEKLDKEALKEFLKPIGIEDPNKLTEVVNKFRADAQKVPELADKVAQYEKLYNDMPDDIVEMIQAWSKNQDYRQVILSRPQLDFSKDTKDVDPKALVEAYFPGKFTKEEWEEYKDPDGDAKTKKAIDFAIERSQEKFPTDKDRFVNRRAEMVKQENARIEALIASAKSSVPSLTNALPEIDPAYAASIEQKLIRGGVKQAFFNEDGTFRSDAALRLAMAEEGMNLIKQLQNSTAKRVESETNEEILTRGAEKGKNRGASAANGKPNDAIQTFFAETLPQTKKNYY